MMNKKKILSAVSAMAILFSNCILLPVHGEHVPRIVILGDSISTGQSLGEGEQSYVDILQEYTHVEVQNFSQDGYRTGDILELVYDPEVKKALRHADAIIVSIGEHDIMDGFIDTANDVVEEFGVKEFPDIFTANPNDYGFESEEDFMPYSNSMASAIRANRNTTIQNILDIDLELEDYQDAKIIWMTMYNLVDNIENYEELTFRRQSVYNGVLNPAKTVIEKINEYIADLEADHERFALVDVYSAFSGNAYQYTNLYQLDLNPTAAGHAVIADLLMQTAEIEAIGDVNGDQEINAADAAAVLKHAASVGAGQGDYLIGDMIKSGDVDGSGSTDARDAAQILAYAAAIGSGGSYTFRLAELPDEEEFADPDPTQPEDEELADPDPTQPDDEELADPDPTQPEDPTEKDPAETETNVNP